MQSEGEAIKGVNFILFSKQFKKEVGVIFHCTRLPVVLIKKQGFYNLNNFDESTLMILLL